MPLTVYKQDDIRRLFRNYIFCLTGGRRKCCRVLGFYLLLDTGDILIFDMAIIFCDIGVFCCFCYFDDIFSEPSLENWRYFLKILKFFEKLNFF